MQPDPSGGNGKGKRQFTERASCYQSYIQDLKLSKLSIMSINYQQINKHYCGYEHIMPKPCGFQVSVGNKILDKIS